MPSLGLFTPACWYNALPQLAEGDYALLDDQGWADQSALFFPRRFRPTAIRMLLTAADAAALRLKVETLERLRTTKVRANDGLRAVNNVLILKVSTVGDPQHAVMIIGGSSSGDTWEQEVAVVVLLPSPDIL